MAAETVKDSAKTALNRATSADPDPSPADRPDFARLILWIGVALAAAAAPAWIPAFPGSDLAPIGALVHSTIALSIMGVLLDTTPDNAIRIPRTWSVGIITVVSVCMAGAMSAGLAGTISAGVLSVLVFGALLTPRTGISPWWGALVLWHPGVWIPGDTTGERLVLHLGALVALGVIALRANGFPTALVRLAWVVSFAIPMGAIVAFDAR